MTDYKTLSVRIPLKMAQLVEVIAEMEHKHQIDVVREAVDAWIDWKRHDKAFQTALQAQVEAQMTLLRSLEL